MQKEYKKYKLNKMYNIVTTNKKNSNAIFKIKYKIIQYFLEVILNIPYISAKIALTLCPWVKAYHFSLFF